MKYYSDKLGKLFETEEDLNLAEEKKAKEELEAEEAKEKASKEKKELAKQIDLAEKELDDAYKDLDLAREQARELQKETLKKLEAILKPAEDKVKKAQEKRYNAIRNFNEHYGAFTTTLTGAKAAEEMRRTLSYFDKLFKDFFL